jgi:hypothetical protein
MPFLCSSMIAFALILIPFSLIASLITHCALTAATDAAVASSVAVLAVLTVVAVVIAAVIVLSSTDALFLTSSTALVISASHDATLSVVVLAIYKLDRAVPLTLLSTLLAATVDGSAVGDSACHLRANCCCAPVYMHKVIQCVVDGEYIH